MVRHHPLAPKRNPRNSEVSVRSLTELVEALGHPLGGLHRERSRRFFCRRWNSVIGQAISHPNYLTVGGAMFLVHEFLRCADACMVVARTATDDKEATLWLNRAKVWADAALRCRNMKVPPD